MTLDQRIALVALIQSARTKDSLLVVCSLIDALDDSQRVAVRNACADAGVTTLPRNLFYNYQTQAWID